MGVDVRIDGSGRVVVHKVPFPRPPGGAAAPGDAGSGPSEKDLRAEADWLRRADGVGAVRLVEGGLDRDRLVTVHAGGHTWRTARPRPPEAVALAADLLRVLGGLHRRGLVHGAVAADHVLLTPEGPVLCSPRPGVDDPGVDRRAVADLLEWTLQGWHDVGTPVPAEDRWRRAIDLLRRPGSGWGPDDVAALLDPAGGARRASRAATAWSASAGPRGLQPARPPWRKAAAVVTVLVATASAVAVLHAGPGADPAGPQRIAVPDATGATSGASGTSGPVATAAEPCPGSPPAAALDPVSGRVWAYPARPTAGREVRGTAVQEVPGATGLAVRRADGCDRIVAVGAAGEVAVPAVEVGDPAGIRPGPTR